MTQNLNILAVDDEELNLDIMQEYFEDADYNSVTAEDGLQALKVLESGEKVDVIVLDRMMPNMDGMEFLKRVKADKRFKDIPVIMQTAASANHQVAEGIEAGVFYYLSKPYTKDVFLSIIRAANDDVKSKNDLSGQIREYGQAMSMLEKGEFKFKTVEEAKVLAVLIGSTFPDPEPITLGLLELLVNGVEHGNLGITYEEKSQLKLDNNWEAEIERRLQLPEYKDKFCTLNIQKTASDIRVHIKDQGKGFDWKKYQVIDPARLTDPNGRGIAITLTAGFDKVDYIGDGSEVECKLSLNKAASAS